MRLLIRGFALSMGKNVTKPGIMLALQLADGYPLPQAFSFRG